MKNSYNKINLLVVGLVILNVLTLSALWFTLLQKPDFPPPPPGDKQGGMLGFFEQELDLNDQQLEEFSKIREKHFVAMRDLNQNQHLWKRALLELAFKMDSDNSTVDSLSQKIGENQSKLEKSIYNHFLEMKAICNDEQKKKLSRLVMEMAGPGEGHPPPLPGDQPPRHPPGN